MEKILWSFNVRIGLEKSRNLMTVELQNLGIKKIVNFSKELGIYDNPKNYCQFLSDLLRQH